MDKKKPEISETGKKISKKVRKAAKNREVALRQVFYDNELRDFGFANFTTTELKMFWNALYVCADQGNREVKVSYSQIKKWANIRSKNKKQTDKVVVDSAKKLLATALYTTNHKGGTSGINLFSRFDTDPIDETLTLQIAEESMHYVNNVIENTMNPELTGGKRHSFSSLDLDFYSSINKKYIMETFRHLESFQYTGMWRINTLKYRFIIGIDREFGVMNEDFENKDIKKKIITPLLKINDESRKFKNLVYEPVFEGRKLKELRFTFDPVKASKQVAIESSGHEIVQDDAEEKKQDISSDMPTKQCIKCGRPLYLMNRKVDGVPFWGHRDYMSGACNYTESFMEYIEEIKPNMIDLSNRIEKYYHDLRHQEEEELRKRMDEVFSEVPRIRAVMEGLREARVSYTKTLFTSNDELKSKLKEEVSSFEWELIELLSSNGYDPNYLEKKYKCNKCNDTGELKDGNKCSCYLEIKKKLAAEL